MNQVTFTITTKVEGRHVGKLTDKILKVMRESGFVPDPSLVRLRVEQHTIPAKKVKK